MSVAPKLEALWSHLPDAARQAVLQALTRALAEAAADESEVTND